MYTTIDEIAPDIFRLSTLVPEVGPGGFSFNQFLVRDEQPFLFHTGMRQLYPLVSRGRRQDHRHRRPALDLVRSRRSRRVRRDEPVPRRRSAGRGHPRRHRLHGVAERPGRSAASRHRRRAAGRSVRTGSASSRPRTCRTGGRAACGSTRRRARCSSGDLFTQGGDVPAIVEDDIVAPALVAEEMFHSTSFSPNLVPTLEQLAVLEPTTLAVMHGSSYRGDGATQLRALAAGYSAARADAA